MKGYVDLSLIAFRLQASLTSFPATQFHHPCTIANPVPQAHNSDAKGNHSPFMVSNLAEALTSQFIG